MDDETAIIDSKTRNEKIKNFFINNKKTLISILLSIIIVLLGYFAFAEYTEKKRLKISDQYNSVISKFSENNKETTKNSLLLIIN